MASPVDTPTPAAVVVGSTSDKNSQTTLCPLCQAMVPAGDDLQLHYLTSCSGYDKVQPRSKLAGQQGGHEGVGSVASGDVETGGGTEGGGSGTTSTVQFMWQPLTEITYPHVILLASFKCGSVDLSIETDGGYYASQNVAITKGTYEGQLVIGESFVHPVKPFKIEKDNDIIVLQFEVVREGRTDESSTSHYGSGSMQQNPSYGHGSGYTYGSEYSAGRTGSYYNQDDYGGSRQQSGGHQRTSDFGYYQQYQNTTYDNSIGGSYSQSSALKRPTDAPSGRDADESFPHPAKEGLVRATGSTSSPVVVTGTAKSSRSHASSSTPYSQPGSQSTATAYSPIGPTSQSTYENIATQSAPSTSTTPAAFNVGRLQGEKAGATEVEVSSLREVLQAVTKERDLLRQNQERVTAVWERRVQRLELRIQQIESGPSDEGFTALHRSISDLETQLEGITRQLDAKQIDVQNFDKELDEMKNRNAALEQQLLEYAGTITDQSKYIRTTFTSTKAQGAEAVRSQQELIHMAEFLKKQQLETDEALSSLRKKVTNAAKVGEENVKMQQLSVGLTAELEDYRTQTRRLVADLRQKEDEIGELKHALSERSGSKNTDLELESMKQKCDAWRQEVENLAPFRDTVNELEVQCLELQRNVDQLRSENEDLTANLQAVIEQSEKKQLTNVAGSSSAEYDELLQKFTELKTVRAGLENELAPLRAERATILRENAALREGEQPEKYARLKEDYTALVRHYDALQADVQEKETLLHAHQDSNYQMQQKLDEATDPEKLHSIRERMERYKNERDKARQQSDELQKQLAEVEMEYDAKASEQVQQLFSESEQRFAEMENKISQQDEQMKVITSRLYRYRDERNGARVLCNELQNRVATLEETIAHLVEKSKMSEPQPYIESGGFDTLDFEQPGIREHSLSPSHEPPHGQEYGQEYDAQNYKVDEEESASHDQYDFTDELPESPVGRSERSLSGEPISKHRSSSTSKSSSSHGRKRTTSGPHNEVGFETVHVKTKDGIVEMYIQKPLALNAKYKPRVVVKRSDGDYEAGTLMFTGVVNGKELAGLQMDLKRSSTSTHSDGTCKLDERRYFKCPTGYGLYVSLSKVYIESQSATV